MPADGARKVSLTTMFRNLKRVALRRHRVYLIDDKEGTQVKPRRPEHVYAPIEAIFATQRAHFLALVDELAPHLDNPRLDAVPVEAAGPGEPYWNNGYFGPVDARVAYALTAARRPRRIVEIGSGHSTRFFRKAIDDLGLSCSLTAIDPSPRAAVEGVADELLRVNLLDLDLARFAALEDGDVLFLDGSHLVFNGTDTTRFFLEILPLLKAGVLVHVHDVCLPYEYSARFTERLYGEQYLLACILMDGGKWRPLLPVYYLDREGAFAGLPGAGLPGAGQDNTSFWMTRL